MNEDAPPFGAFAPSSMEEKARRLAHKLPRNYFGRKAASLLLGPAGGRSGRTFDVEVFGGQRARLYPGDNISEKRVFITPQFWEHEEREALAAAIAAHQEHFFHFMDVGANAGLYTLFARGAALRAGIRLRALCVEPDPEMRARLRFNLDASGGADEARLFPYAAAARDATVRFAVDVKSRGMSRVDETGGLIVEGRTLLSMLTEWGAPRVDAMKIDIEGHEHAALEAFFRVAPRVLWPRFLILETSHEAPERSAKALALAAGYVEILQTRRNFAGLLTPSRSNP